jgi:hypothetical protein
LSSSRSRLLFLLMRRWREKLLLAVQWLLGEGATVQRKETGSVKVPDNPYFVPSLSHQLAVPARSQTGTPPDTGCGGRRGPRESDQSVPNSIAARSSISSSSDASPRDAIASAPPCGIAPISPVDAA